SYKTSQRNIEPELLRIILTNNSLDEVVSNADIDVRLSDSLTILKGRGEAFGFEPFPGTFLGPKSENAILLLDIHNLLVGFYNNAKIDFQFTAPGDILGIEQIA
ncbi:19985_t:CDS:2, partial [Dentiscutata erythropus]